MKKLRKSIGHMWVAVPPPVLEHMQNTKEFITLHKGSFFLLLLICFVAGCFLALGRRNP